MALKYFFSELRIWGSYLTEFHMKIKIKANNKNILLSWICCVVMHTLYINIK